MMKPQATCPHERAETHFTSHRLLLDKISEEQLQLGFNIAFHKCQCKWAPDILASKPALPLANSSWYTQNHGRLKTNTLYHCHTFKDHKCMTCQHITGCRFCSGFGLCSFLLNISPTWALHIAMTRKHRKSDSAPTIISDSYQNIHFHVKIHSGKMTQKCVGRQTKLGGTSIMWLVQIWSKRYNIILRCFWGNGKTKMSQRLPVGLHRVVIWSRRTFWARWSTFEKQRLIII